jgi:hypothetical protein
MNDQTIVMRASANPGTFGGPIRTPTLDRLAARGLKYNGFHVTAAQLFGICQRRWSAGLDSSSPVSTLACHAHGTVGVFCHAHGTTWLPVMGPPGVSAWGS